MKYILITIYFLSVSLLAQQPITTQLIQKDSINADLFIAKNNFDNLYIIKDNILIKKSKNNTYNYSSIQLGNITSVHTFNPLKINAFYADLNTVVILDNRLTEIFKIDFNALDIYKNISHITTGFDNTLWLFNQDFQYLELYDYKTQTTRYKTIPITSKVLDLTSSYNYCWLLTQNYLYCYNYFGSLVYKIKNDNYLSVKANNEDLVIKKENGLIYYNHKTKSLSSIVLPNMLISQFSVTNQILYIYSRKTLYQYQFKID